MSTATPDFSTMTAAQIKDYIESNPQAEPEQPRDPKTGQFVAAEPEPEVTPEGVTPEGEEELEAEPEQVVEECEIDLNDGSGVQLFRGVGASREEALAALNQELIKAQTNATRKIRELSQRKTEQPPAEPTLNPDQELALSQRLLSNPSQVLREEREKAKKEALDEIRAQQEAAEKRANEENAAANQFMQETPDFYQCPKNGQRIEKWLRLNGRFDNGHIPTVDDIREAYTDLNTDGLIVQKPVEKTSTARSSGLSTRNTATPPPPKDIRTEASKMTLDQLREAAGGYQYSY